MHSAEQIDNAAVQFLFNNGRQHLNEQLLVKACADHLSSTYGMSLERAEHVAFRAHAANTAPANTFMNVDKSDAFSLVINTPNGEYCLSLAQIAQLIRPEMFTPALIPTQPEKRELVPFVPEQKATVHQFSRA